MLRKRTDIDIMAESIANFIGAKRNIGPVRFSTLDENSRQSVCLGTFRFIESEIVDLLNQPKPPGNICIMFGGALRAKTALGRLELMGVPCCLKRFNTTWNVYFTLIEVTD